MAARVLRTALRTHDKKLAACVLVLTAWYAVKKAPRDVREQQTTDYQHVREALEQWQATGVLQRLPPGPEAELPPLVADPDARYLRQGIKAKGWVLLNEVSIGYEVWRQLNGFPVSLPEEPDAASAQTSQKATKK